MKPKNHPGRPRNPMPDGWLPLLVDIRDRTARRNGPSLRGMAAAIGVTHATVNRWMKGGAFPSVDRVLAIQQWIKL